MESTADPAPALGRGLTLLQILDREGASSLDQLTRHSGWPKSSVLRLLRSLEAFGAVEREPESKRYAASLRLVAVAGAEGLLRQAARGELARLADATGSSAELFAWREQRLLMIDRADPEAAEVVVRMRVGSGRALDELEALSQVVHACAEAPRCERYWAWHGGRQQPLEPADVAARIANAAHGLGEDPQPNGFGISRLAAPLRGPGGQLLGVLALARAHHARTPERDRLAAGQLIATASRISTRCGCEQRLPDPLSVSTP